MNEQEQIDEYTKIREDTFSPREVDRFRSKIQSNSIRDRDARPISPEKNTKKILHQKSKVVKSKPILNKLINRFNSRLSYKRSSSPQATIIIPAAEDIPLRDRSRFFQAAIKKERQQLYFND